MKNLLVFRHNFQKYLQNSPKLQKFFGLCDLIWDKRWTIGTFVICIFAIFVTVSFAQKIDSGETSLKQIFVQESKFNFANFTPIYPRTPQQGDQVHDFTKDRPAITEPVTTE